MTRTGAFLLALLLGQEPSPIRMPAATGSISGVVVRAGSEEILRDVEVELRSAYGNVYLEPRRIASTQDSGAFAFTNLVPGRYTLHAKESLESVPWTGSRTSGVAALLTLSEGQRLAGMRFRLPEPGVIYGTVRNATGAPVALAAVEALSVQYRGEHRVLVVARETVTNDLGEYRLTPLLPGAYYVRAVQASADVRRAYSPVAVPMEPRLATRTGSDVFLPVYHANNVVDDGEARPIAVGAGVKVGGIDFSLRGPVPGYRIRGRVIDDRTGTPYTNALMLLRPRGASPDAVITQASGGNPLGVFEMNGIVPGSYYLVATSGGPPYLPTTAVVPIEVRNADIVDLDIRIVPFSITGRVVIEGSPSSNNISPSQLLQSIHLEPEALGRNDSLEFRSALPGPDGAFAYRLVTPGAYRIRVITLTRPTDLDTPSEQPTVAQRTYVKAITLGGQDILENGFRAERQPDTPVQIVLSTDGATLRGTVRGTGGRSGSNMVVALVPAKPLRQRADRYRAVLSNDAASFAFYGIPPGDYSVFAWDSVLWDAWRNADFMERNESRGQKLTLGEGQSANIEVTVTP